MNKQLLGSVVLSAARNADHQGKMMKTSKGYFRRNTQKRVQFNCLFVASFRRALKGDGSP